MLRPMSLSMNLQELKVWVVFFVGMLHFMFRDRADRGSGSAAPSLIWDWWCHNTTHMPNLDRIPMSRSKTLPQLRVCVDCWVHMLHFMYWHRADRESGSAAPSLISNLWCHNNTTHMPNIVDFSDGTLIVTGTELFCKINAYGCYHSKVVKLTLDSSGAWVMWFFCRKGLASIMNDIRRVHVYD